jgi:hypothetical protein
VKTFSAAPQVLTVSWPLGRSLAAAVAFGAFGALATGCAHEARPAVSSSAVTTTSASVASGRGDRAETTLVLANQASLDPDGPTSAHPASVIPDARTSRAHSDEIPPMGRWSSRYPDAARLLAAWESDHEGTARKLGSWAARNPEQMRTWVDWAITNQAETLGAFFFDRSTFGELRALADTDRPAVDALLAWIRSATPAAEELAAHPTGLTFAANHRDQLAQARAEEPVATP